MDPTKAYTMAPLLQLTEGSIIQSGNPSGILVGYYLANPPGKPTPFLTVGQTVRVIYNYVDPDAGKLEEETKTFIVTGMMLPTGNNILDSQAIIDTGVGNSLFHKMNRYDSIIVAA
jgi:putative ABC transport system permease protein